MLAMEGSGIRGSRPLRFAGNCRSATDAHEISGGHSGRATPVPIPNTEVKPASADGTWGASPWESRTPPDLFLTTVVPNREVGATVVIARAMTCSWAVPRWVVFSSGDRVLAMAL